MKIFFLLIFEILFFIFNLEFAHGQTMENGMYSIQEGDVSTFDFDSFVSKDINNRESQNKLGHYSGTNYSVKSGNSYNPDLTPLSFSISNVVVDFGRLSPTNPVLRNSKLTIKNNSSYAYKVTGAENNPLTEVKTASKIPDTRCDDGQCSEAISSKWNSTLAYGFGYRCETKSGSCALGDYSFTKEDYYKQFSDSSLSESAAEVLSGPPVSLQEATIIYKVNIPSSQPQGFYTNTVTFLALPSY